MSLRLRNSWRGSFALRLAATCALLSALLSVGGLSVLYLVVKSHMKHATDAGMASDMREIFIVVDRSNLDGVRACFDAITASQGSMDSFYHLMNAQGETLAGSKLTPWQDVAFDPQRLKGLSARKPIMRTVVLKDARKSARVLEARVADNLYLQMGLSLEETNKFLFHLRRVATWLVVILLAGSTVTGWLVARRAMSGIRRITRAVERVTGGSFGDRVPVSPGGDEISHLGRTFNDMAERVQTTLAEMRQLNSNIAHDLRSPITRIRGVAETSLLTADNQQEFQETAGSVIEECDRLLLLINTTLDIAEAEAGIRRLDLSTFDLAEVAQQAAEIFRPVAEENGVRLGTRLTRTPVRGELPRIQRAVANLVDNAVKFTPHGGEVLVTVSESQGCARLVVRDTGPGILPRDLPHVFTRFYRGDKSRHLPGHGLGLSLASAFVRANGGDLSVESEPGQGSIFTIRLPAASG